MFTNYTKEIEKLQEVSNKEHIRYENELKLAKRHLEQVQNEFNAEIGVINCERSLMRDEIYKLHDFLSKFGDVGKEIGPFDFVIEPYQTLAPDGITRDIVDETSGEKSALSGIAEALGVYKSIAIPTTIPPTIPIPVPTAVPIRLIMAAAKKRSNRKKEYLNRKQEFEKQKLDYEEKIDGYKQLLKYVELMVEIARLYRTTITGIRDIVKKTIIEEVQGINAFLYADAIKNCVLFDESVTEIEPANILEYEGTPYEKHLNFVKNAVDYYGLITKMFQNRVITEMMSNTDREKVDSFKKELEMIETQGKKIEEESVFGGD